MTTHRVAVVAYDGSLVQELIDRGVRFGLVVGDLSGKGIEIAREHGIGTATIQLSHPENVREAQTLARCLSLQGIDVALISNNAPTIHSAVFEQYTGWILYVGDDLAGPRPVDDHAAEVSMDMLLEILAGTVGLDLKSIFAQKGTT